ncbi:MAG TPA: hypothetical protein ENH55_16730 [Aurantimonas coralicida]|uniref:Uncharacterized protein n=1 Tax=marine sediment metagenome TaxID=412755 RepID=A0A0F9QRL9_9ZZZZ|nr:hypothetical protein [Aurantimonas coralicida]
MTFKVLYRAAKGEFEEAMAEMKRPMAEAATAAIEEAGATIKVGARADIARAGFSKRFQNALRVDTFPRRPKVSIDAAAFIFSKVPYAEVFESGATIRGKPRLWIPLEGTPKKIGRDRMTAKRFAQRIGPLTFLDRGGRRPLLGARAALTRSQANKARPKVSLAALRRGADGTATGRTVLRTVPLFLGVSSIVVPKKFSVRKIIDKAAGRLAEIYVRKIGKGI